MLHKAQSWEKRVDLGEKLQFPQVVQTTLRPDVVIWSEEARRIILIDLTIPWKEACTQASEGKCNKYRDLVQDRSDKGWQKWLFLIEVSHREFPEKCV